MKQSKFDAATEAPKVTRRLQERTGGKLRYNPNARKITGSRPVDKTPKDEYNAVSATFALTPGALTMALENAVSPLKTQLDRQEAMIQSLSEQVEELTEDRPIITPLGLWSLDSPTHELASPPVQIVIEEWPDEEYIAHWHDVEAIGIGDTQAEAIAALKEDIVSLHMDLQAMDESKLGACPLAWKRILNRTIRER